MRPRNEREDNLQDQENILPKGRLLVVFGCLALVQMFSFMDQNGVSVALPTIAADLHAENTIPWAGTSSLIANTVFSVLYGRLSDIFGRKPIFLIACSLLALADLLCGLAQNATMFYICRALAGLAGGGITNLAMIFVSDIVTLEERGKYQGIIGASVGLGNLAGPFLAAGFVGTHASWRGFFWFLAPVVTACTVVASFLLPSTRFSNAFREKLKNIDYLGCLTSSAAIILILIPISGGGLYFQWESPMVISMLAIGSCAFLVFLFIEWKLADLPMMPIDIFRDRNINALLFQSFMLGWVYQSYLYYLPQYYQNVRGYSAIVSAALSAPIAITQAIASILSGQYISRRKRYGEVIWFGFGMWTLGAGLTILFDRNTHPAICVVALSIIGVGVGNVFQPTLVALQAHSPKRQRAVIISNRNFVRCTGGACGLAISATILQTGLLANLPTRFKYIAASIYSFPHFSDPQSADIVLSAYMKATKVLYIVNTAVIGLCFCACFLVHDKGLQRKEDVTANNAMTAPQDEKSTQARQP